MSTSLDRVMWIEITRDIAQPVREVHRTTADTTDRDWLAILLHAAQAEWPDRQQRLVDYFAKSSVCGMRGCSQLVEVGAHMTIDGNQLIVVPTCGAHNTAGAIDRLGVNAYVKAHQAYGIIRFRPGMGLRHSDGKYHLEKNFSVGLPDLEDA